MAAASPDEQQSAPTRLVLIRHAAVDLEDRLCGSFDPPLSSAGVAQVEEMARRAHRGSAPDVLFTSTLQRARAVAGRLASAWELPMLEAPWAREIDCGEVEGMRFADVQRRYPAHWARNHAQADDAFSWPGGETYAAFRARILDGLRVAAAAHAGGCVVVVTHAGVIAQVLGVVRGRHAAAWMPDRPRPLTVTEVTWEDGAPRHVLRYDEPDWT